ncbi:MAG: radical SAM protein [Deltaproteobacteria bacterium]|nr:radical SAM protein [Deltaproteobacteria bacterium]
MSRPVDEVIRELLGPLLEARPSPSQWKLLSWDVDQGLTLTLERDHRLIMIEMSVRDTTQPCWAHTERFNIVARRPFADRSPLDSEQVQVVEHFIQLIRAREGRLPTFERPQTSRKSVVREIEVDRVLVAEGAGHYYVNPYVGCMIGCEFCWAGPNADFSRALEGLPSLPWGRWVDVKINAPEILRRELAVNAPGIVRMSPVVTDPYQSLERTFRITRGCITAMADAGFSPVILTREGRVVEDIEILKRCPSAGVGFSIPTDDDSIRAAFEPGGSPIAERLEALQACHAAGLSTFVVVQPVLPMDPARLVALVAPYVRAVRIDRMHAVSRMAYLYERAGRLDAMSDAFAARLERELRAGFEARGVSCDDLDDLGAALKVRRKD